MLRRVSIVPRNYSAALARLGFEGITCSTCQDHYPASDLHQSGQSNSTWSVHAGLNQRHCYSNLREAAQAAETKVDVSDDLLSRLKDPKLVHSAGLIGGKWKTTSATFEVRNPATGEVLARMPKMRGEETKAAIASAHSVLPEWRLKTAKERGAVLRRWSDLIIEHVDDIATVMTMEGGKPLAEAKAEALSGAASVEWCASEGRRVHGDVLETVSRGQRMVTIRQPVGVVGAITPWNFPMSMITRKTAPALAAGCTVVLKPSEFTPLTAVVLAELADRAGLPDGVLNIVMGDAPAIGQALLQSETVRKIGFTGSTNVGKLLMSGAAQTVKRVSLELGGNAPFIVFEDADLELAASAVLTSALRNSGQTCICANRVFVHDAVYDKFSDMVSHLASKLRVGNGLDAGTTHGPLINAAAVDKVVAHVADAVAKGGKVLTGGNKPSSPALANGHYYEPTVLRDATIDMRCFREETFGPLLPLFRFSSDEEVLMLANDTEYGLAAYFYTRDLARAWRIAEELEYGMVGVNEISITSEVAPFGGVKQSGMGRENGLQALDEFLETKYICMGLGYSP